MMETHLPQGLQDSRRLDMARRSRRALYILSDGERISVINRWDGGFSTPRSGPQLSRGIVDLYDGKTHVSHGLAYLASVEEDARIYAFKTVRDPALSPPADHVRLTPVPIALLTGKR